MILRLSETEVRLKFLGEIIQEREVHLCRIIACSSFSILSRVHIIGLKKLAPEQTYIPKSPFQKRIWKNHGVFICLFIGKKGRIHFNFQIPGIWEGFENWGLYKKSSKTKLLFLLPSVVIYFSNLPNWR